MSGALCALRKRLCRMGISDPLPLLDRLKAAQEKQRVELARSGAVVISGIGQGTMRFKAGDAVIDLATGKRGVVRVAEPRAGRGGQLYGIDLADGRLVFRGVDELALDVPAAAV